MVHHQLLISNRLPFHSKYKSNDRRAFLSFICVAYVHITMMESIFMHKPKHIHSWSSSEPTYAYGPHRLILLYTGKRSTRLVLLIFLDIYSSKRINLKMHSHTNTFKRATYLTWFYGLA